MPDGTHRFDVAPASLNLSLVGQPVLSARSDLGHVPAPVPARLVARSRSSVLSPGAVVVLAVAAPNRANRAGGDGGSVVRRRRRAVDSRSQDARAAPRRVLAAPLVQFLLARDRARLCAGRRLAPGSRRGRRVSPLRSAGAAWRSASLCRRRTRRRGPSARRCGCRASTSASRRCSSARLRRAPAFAPFAPGRGSALIGGACYSIYLVHLQVTQVIASLAAKARAERAFAVGSSRSSRVSALAVLVRRPDLLRRDRAPLHDAQLAPSRLGGGPQSAFDAARRLRGPRRRSSRETEPAVAKRRSVVEPRRRAGQGAKARSRRSRGGCRGGRALGGLGLPLDAAPPPPSRRGSRT